MGCNPEQPYIIHKETKKKNWEINKCKLSIEIFIHCFTKLENNN